LQIFVDLVLIRMLQLLQQPVGQRLLRRPTADFGMPAGWMAGTGARASLDAKDPAADGSGGAVRLHVGIDRFRAVWQVREAASAAVGGGAEARACGQAARAVPPGCAEVGRVAWARVRARLLP